MCWLLKLKSPEENLKTDPFPWWLSKVFPLSPFSALSLQEFRPLVNPPNPRLPVGTERKNKEQNNISKNNLARQVTETNRAG